MSEELSNNSPHEAEPEPEALIPQVKALPVVPGLNDAPRSVNSYPVPEANLSTTLKSPIVVASGVFLIAIILLGLILRVNPNNTGISGNVTTTSTATTSTLASTSIDTNTYKLKIPATWTQATAGDASRVKEENILGYKPQDNSGAILVYGPANSDSQKLSPTMLIRLDKAIPLTTLRSSFPTFKNQLESSLNAQNITIADTKVNGVTSLAINYQLNPDGINIINNQAYFIPGNNALIDIEIVDDQVDWSQRNAEISLILNSIVVK